MSCVLRSMFARGGVAYAPVVPLPAYGFAALVSNNEDLNSLNSGWVKCVLPEGTMEPLTNC